MARESIAAQDAWNQAVLTHAHLWANGRIRPIELPDLVLAAEEGEEFLAEFGRSMQYARFYQADIFWYESPRVVAGSPQFVTGYLLASMARRTYKNHQARRLSQPRWWSTDLLGTVLTSRRLWCQIGEPNGNRWLNFNYDTITRLDLTSEGLILSFLASAPLRLSGSWAPWCAAVIAHLRLGRDAAAAVPALHHAAFAR